VLSDRRERGLSRRLAFSSALRECVPRLEDHYTCEDADRGERGSDLTQPDDRLRFHRLALTRLHRFGGVEACGELGFRDLPGCLLGERC